MADVWANSMACYPDPPATLQCAATWRIQCHDLRASCHIAGCCGKTNSTACHFRAKHHIAGCCHLVNLLSWFQSHVSHCRVQTELVSVKFPGVSRYDEQIKRLHFGRNWYKSKGAGYTRELLNPSQSVLPRCPTSAGATTGIPYTFSTVKNLLKICCCYIACAAYAQSVCDS